MKKLAKKGKVPRPRCKASKFQRCRVNLRFHLTTRGALMERGIPRGPQFMAGIPIWDWLVEKNISERTGHAKAWT